MDRIFLPKEQSNIEFISMIKSVLSSEIEKEIEQERIEIRNYVAHRLAVNERSQRIPQPQSYSSYRPLMQSNSPSEAGRRPISQHLVEQTMRARTTVQYVAQQPPSQHIRLSSLSLTAVRQFITDLVQYQNAHGIILPAATLVSEGVRDRLIASYEDLDEHAFYLLTTKQLCLLLQDYVQPQSRLSFLSSLERQVVFPALPAGYRPTPINFTPLYSALLQYRRNFEAVFDLLKSAVETPDVIPPATTKRGGLVKLFVEKIPFLYGYRFIEDRGLHTFASLDAFLDDFYAFVEAHREVCREAANMQQSFSGAVYFSGSSVPVKTQQAARADTSRQDKSSPALIHPVIVAEYSSSTAATHEEDGALPDVLRLTDQEQSSDDEAQLFPHEESVHLDQDAQQLDDLGQTQRSEEVETAATVAAVSSSRRSRKPSAKASIITGIQSNSSSHRGGGRRFWQPP